MKHDIEIHKAIESTKIEKLLNDISNAETGEAREDYIDLRAGFEIRDESDFHLKFKHTLIMLLRAIKEKLLNPNTAIRPLILPDNAARMRIGPAEMPVIEWGITCLDNGLVINTKYDSRVDTFELRIILISF